MFSGAPNWLEAVTETPDRSALCKGLGGDYEILGGTLKMYSVGSPAQAAVAAIVDIVERDGVTASGVTRIEIRLPSDSAVIVDNRTMPSINVQYLVTNTLLDRRFSFAMSHDTDRMTSPETTRLLALTELCPDESIKGTRDAIVTVEHRPDDGGPPITHRRHIRHVRGTAASPMNVAEVRAKAMDLLTGVRDDTTSARFCDEVINLGTQSSVRAIMAKVG